ncbi:hypothetical protein LINPERHAP1_LOCUS6194, partial [Linum perenne]
GLERTWNAGYRRVLLQLDSTTAINLLWTNHDPLHQHGLEAMQFKDLCNRDWTVKIIHTFREGNQAADFVASAGYDYPTGVTVFQFRIVTLATFCVMIVWVLPNLALFFIDD